MRKAKKIEKMEVFQVFATMNLVDMMSRPLASISQRVQGLDKQSEALNSQFGELNSSILAISAASGVLLGIFSACAASASDFENAMADVAKVVNFTAKEEFTAMQASVLELSRTIPMAASGIADIVANAGQSGIAKEHLAEFAEQAAKMGVAFDLMGDQAGKMMADWQAGMALSLPRVYGLANAVNHLSNNLNATAPALGEVLQRAGSLGIMAGLAEQEVAALSAAFLSSGTSPEIAATALSKFVNTLTKGEAMTKSQAKAFALLGFSGADMAKRMQKDAKGVIFDVLDALSAMPKYMHNSLLTQMFGEESIKAIAPLLGNMQNLEKAFKLVANKADYAGSMQAEFEVRSNTAANALQLLKNKLNILAITVGTYFLPAIKLGTKFLGFLTDTLTFAAQSPLGRMFLELTAVLTVLAAGFGAVKISAFAFSLILPKITAGLHALKLMFLGLSFPLQAIIVGFGLLYAAYRTNFGGIADSADHLFSRISLVFSAVRTLLANFKDGTSVLGGDLARSIHQAGLVDFVTLLVKAINRLKAVATGFFGVFAKSLQTVHAVFSKTFGAVLWLIEKVLSLFTDLSAVVFGGYFQGNLSAWENLGRVLGVLAAAFLVLKGILVIVAGTIAAVTAVMKVLTLAANGLGIALRFASANPMVLAIAAIILAIGALLYYFDEVKAFWNNLVTAFWDGIEKIKATFISLKDTVFRVFSDIKNAVFGFFENLDLFESGAKLLSTFKDGILSSVSSLKDTVADALQSVRNLLPFSDAKEGPLSSLTLSGSRLLSTIGEGVSMAAPQFLQSVSSVFGQILPNVRDTWKGLLDFADNVFANRPADEALEKSPNPEMSRTESKNITVYIENISLPNVQNASDFMIQLENELLAYGEQ